MTPPSVSEHASKYYDQIGTDICKTALVVNSGKPLAADMQCEITPIEKHIHTPGCHSKIITMNHILKRARVEFISCISAFAAVGYIATFR